MTLRISKDQLISMRPCYPNKRIALFGRRKYLTAAQALSAGATISDILWVAGRLDLKDLIVRFAVECAQRVAANSFDPRVQAAIDAAKTWIEDPTDSAMSAANRAASSAMSAAWSATSSAAWSAESAARSAARSATSSAAWIAMSAARSAARSAANSAASSAASSAESAAWRVAWYAEEEAQKALLIRIFN